MEPLVRLAVLGIASLCLHRVRKVRSRRRRSGAYARTGQPQCAPGVPQHRLKVPGGGAHPLSSPRPSISFEDDAPEPSACSPASSLCGTDRRALTLDTQHYDQWPCCNAALPASPSAVQTPVARPIAPASDTESDQSPAALDERKASHCCAASSHATPFAAGYSLRSPATTIARPPRNPGTSSSALRPLLPTPPPAGASGLRSIHRTPSAPADCRTPGGDDAAVPSSPPLSVRARALRFEGRESGSALRSSWSATPATWGVSLRSLATSPAAVSCTDSCGSDSDSGRASSPDSSSQCSPRSSCGGSGRSSLLRASWAGSGSCKASAGGEGSSFLPFARASQREAFWLPCKPNMPRIEGL